MAKKSCNELATTCWVLLHSGSQLTQCLKLWQNQALSQTLPVPWFLGLEFLHLLPKRYMFRS